MWTLILAGAVAACTKANTEAEKESAFKHASQGPAGTAAPETEPIAVDKLHLEESIQTKVLAMPFREKVQRLGAFRMNQRGSMVFEVAGKQTYAQREVAVLAFNSAGDFWLRVEIDGQKATEAVWFKGTLYTRERDAAFAQRPQDLLGADRIARGYATTVKEFLSRFAGRLAFTPQGKLEHVGRQALRYDIGLNAAGLEETKLGDSAFRPEELADPGLMAPGLASWGKTGRAKRAAGHIIVDAQTGVLLTARFSGTQIIPVRPGKQAGYLATAKPLIVTFGIEHDVTDIGVDPQIEEPKQLYAKQTVPRAVGDPLDFYRDKLPLPPPSTATAASAPPPP